MDTNQLYRSAARLIPVAAASALITLFGCVPTEPVITPPSTKPDSQYFGGVETASGDVYATGYLNIPVGVGNYYASSFVLRKFDAKQKLLWERQYPDPTQSGYITAMSQSLPTDNAGKFIQLAGDGSVYVAAKLQKPGNYGKAHADVDYDIALLKYSANGDLLWTKYVDLKKKDSPLDLQLDANGNLYLQGRTVTLTVPVAADVVFNVDFFHDFVASYNSNGDFRWKIDFNAPGVNYMDNMQFQDDGFYMGGRKGGKNCGTIYKADFAGHIAPVSPYPPATCPYLAVVVGDHAVFNPSTSGDNTSVILALNNLGSIEKTITWNDIVLPTIHADAGSAYVEYQLADRLQPNSFFVLLSGGYDVNGPDGPWDTVTQLVHMNSSGDVLSIVPITNADGTSAGLLGHARLTQTASGDVIISTVLEYPTDSGGGDFYVVNYNSHAVTNYSLAPNSLLSSFTGLGVGQQRLVVGSQFADGVWTPVIKRFDQVQ